MFRLLKHEESNYFANMGWIHIYNNLTNQLINQSTISVVVESAANFKMANYLAFSRPLLNPTRRPFYPHRSSYKIKPRHQSWHTSDILTEYRSTLKPKLRSLKLDQSKFLILVIYKEQVKLRTLCRGGVYPRQDRVFLFSSATRLIHVRTKPLCAGQAGINPAPTLSINGVNLSKVDAHAQGRESGYINLASVLFSLGLSK
jgi:hypothetical protein